MQTQISCPACHTPYVTDVYQIVDVGAEPELKQMLLSGYLNVAQCPACGAVTQVATPLLYHDPENEIFWVYVPMELNLSLGEQEELIGRLVRQTIDSLPSEQRRGYMLQPQTILSLRTLVDKVLETEGITPEMVERQQAQADLLQAFLTADADAANSLIREQADLIDETFFAMIRVMMNGAESSKQEAQLLKLLNLQARLYRDTAIGRKLERQQAAVRALSREANKEDGISPALLLKHVLANRDDEAIVESLISAGMPAFNYEFFVLLSERIEKREKAGVDATELVNLRATLLELQSNIERQSRELLDGAQETLRDLLSAADKDAAIKANLSRIDDTVMYVLEATYEQAQRSGKSDQAAALLDIRNRIFMEMENQAPPEIRYVNRLLRARTDDEIRRLLEDDPPLTIKELLQLLDGINDEAVNRGDGALTERIQRVLSVVETKA